MNRNPVVWFEIYVQDMRRAKTFYETVLGVELTEDGVAATRVGNARLSHGYGRRWSVRRIGKGKRLSVRWHGHAGLFLVR